MNWYSSNYSQITWFLIGFLISAGLTDLARGDTTDAVINFALAGINYLFVRK